MNLHSHLASSFGPISIVTYANFFGSPSASRAPNPSMALTVPNVAKRRSRSVGVMEGVNPDMCRRFVSSSSVIVVVNDGNWPWGTRRSDCDEGGSHAHILSTATTHASMSLRIRDHRCAAVGYPDAQDAITGAERVSQIRLVWEPVSQDVIKQSGPLGQAVHVRIYMWWVTHDSIVCLPYITLSPHGHAWCGPDKQGFRPPGCLPGLSSYLTRNVACGAPDSDYCPLRCSLHIVLSLLTVS
jgi:hypothetical protein